MNGDEYMKEATGEGAMTIITISLVSLALGLGAIIIYTVLDNQSTRTDCENAGYSYHDGKCHDDEGNVCSIQPDGVCE